MKNDFLTSFTLLKIIIFSFIFIIGSQLVIAQSSLNNYVYPPKYEFRAVWIATINNIDFPSQAGLSVEQQKEEYRRLLDFHQNNGMNAVIVQVRPAGDAFYQSDLEPWSQWLTGKQGEAPFPFYDPLVFMIEETHKRNMEFHAWLNPFRAVANVYSDKLHTSHIVHKKKEWFLAYGQLKLFNPGIPAVRDYLVSVVADIVRRYDVDGIHFDDYFYPYPDPQYKLKDEPTFKLYGKGFKRLADWRRENLNLFIKGVHEAIKKEKNHVKFGVSPYGVWRNSREDAYGSNTRSGYTCYDHLHADVRHWLKEGWIDYVAPQLYQHRQHKTNPYKELVDWWADNSFGKHVYIGNAPYRIHWDNDPNWKSNTEMPEQLRYSRGFTYVKGNIFYSSKALLKNRGGFTDSLRQHFYNHPAIVPLMPWKDSIAPLPPLSPVVSLAARGVVLSWLSPEKAKDGELPSYYIIYRTKSTEIPDIQNPKHLYKTLPSHITDWEDEEAKSISDFNYVITSMDRLRNESTVANVKYFEPIPPKPILIAGQTPDNVRILSNLMVQNIQLFLNVQEDKKEVFTKEEE
jgi:uncharacterized lipoprotein YddW (UPF0748 family)